MEKIVSLFVIAIIASAMLIVCTYIGKKEEN